MKEKGRRRIWKWRRKGGEEEEGRGEGGEQEKDEEEQEKIDFSFSLLILSIFQPHLVCGISFGSFPDWVLQLVHSPIY
jgi:hypothetical protein